MAEIVRDKNLKNLNTFGINASASNYAEFRTLDELRKLFDYQRTNDLQWYILGGGSNILFTEDYQGLIIHPVCSDIMTTHTEGDKIYVQADAGTVWDDLVGFAVEHGLWGIENLYGIPGLVGSSPIQNIGAYGVEAKDCIHSVKFYDKEKNKIFDLSASECKFGYRDSIFKNELKGKGVILSVTYCLSTKENPRLDYGDLRHEAENNGKLTLKGISEAVITIRNGKLPDPKILGNSGSFFKNPVVNRVRAEELKKIHPDIPVYPHGDNVKLAAGWLIDKAGWKGRRINDAGVHDKQALVLVNYGRSSGKEILELAESIKKDIKTIFYIDMETEVNIL
ncbi:MAG: UDP-N-acetylmuramate dehydrogenase [Rikenellaceae bacterium]|nr:UDP-N-acetylmuramate dehydrogenase [Rikenellaceae bacterium]